LSASHPLKRPGVAGHVSGLIRERIACGLYPSGTLLPSQRELAEQLGVSRTALREALSTLQGMGLLVVRPGKGMYVAETRAHAANGTSQDVQMPGWRFSDTCALADMYQLRFVLEGFAAHLSAQAVVDDDLAFLRENLAQMRQCIEADELGKASALDFAFHLHIATLSGNRAMTDILHASQEMMQESQRLPFYQRSARGATCREHGAIIEALAQGDSRLAQQAMTLHIVQAAQRAGVHFPAG